MGVPLGHQEGRHPPYTLARSEGGVSVASQIALVAFVELGEGTFAAWYWLMAAM